MADVLIRPFEERDYPATVSVGNSVYSDYPWSVEEARHEDARYDGTHLIQRRFVAEVPTGRIVASAEFHHTSGMYHPRKFWLDIAVHPEFQRRGIGERLYATLIGTLAPFEPLVLWTGVRETFDQSIRFMTKRGFQESRRAWESRLDVASFDPAPFEAHAREAVKDLQIVTVAEERERDPDWLGKVYDLHTEVNADVPRVEAYTPVTLDEYANHLLKYPGYLPEAHFLVKDGDRYVTESFMFRSEQLPGVLYQGLTGTRRDYRGRGLALALKLRTIAFARAYGAREIRTWNDTLNAPMLRINTKLGFVRQPAWITFEKRP